MTVASVTVRAARESDAPRLAEILAAGSLSGHEDTGDVRSYVSAIREIDTTPGCELLVAELDGRVVGTCQLITFRHVQHRGGRCAEIESVHVDEAHRSGGIGGVLLEAAVTRARRAGCYRLQLTSNKIRRDAHRFYLHHGFEASHEGFKLVM